MDDESSIPSGLDLESGVLENIAEGASREFNLLNDGFYPVLAVLGLIAAVVLTIYWAKKRTYANGEATALLNTIQLRFWPVGLRAALIPLIVGYALTHVFAAYSAYYSTTIANLSSVAYWEVMGIGRLSSLTHAHLFAHATMYFLLATLTQLTNRGAFFKVYLPVAALWAGVFDAISWWGHKLLSPSFEILTIFCGVLFSLGFLGMAWAVLYELIQGRHANAPPKI